MKKQQYQHAIELETRIQQLQVFHTYLKHFFIPSNPESDFLLIESSVKILGTNSVNPMHIKMPAFNHHNKIKAQQDITNILNLVDEYIKKLEAEYSDMFDADEVDKPIE